MAAELVGIAARQGEQEGQGAHPQTAAPGAVLAGAQRVFSISTSLVTPMMDESRRWGGRCRALDVHADEHAGVMNMYMMRTGPFLRREGPESEPATACPVPRVLRSLRGRQCPASL